MTLPADALRHEVPPLPFELQVLEVALGDVCALVSQLGKELEAVAHPALDALMKSVRAAEAHGALPGCWLGAWRICCGCAGALHEVSAPGTCC